MTAEAAERQTHVDRNLEYGPNRPFQRDAPTVAGARGLIDRAQQATPAQAPSDRHHSPTETDATAARVEENSHWTRALTDQGPAREAAADALYAYLLRAARNELAHRASTSRLSGPERDDLAHQSAADALVSVIRRIPDFRGESMFTTWARSFVTFEVRVKIRQHNRRSGFQTLVDEDWDRITSSGSHGPDADLEASELRQAVVSATMTALTARQRAVFVGIVVHGASIEQLAAQLGSNRNAVYQLMFHARRNVRRQLAERGFMYGLSTP